MNIIRISLSSLQNLLKRHSLDFFDVKLIKTHGGSLRIFIKRKIILDIKNHF